MSKKSRTSRGPGDSTERQGPAVDATTVVEGATVRLPTAAVSTATRDPDGTLVARVDAKGERGYDLHASREPRVRDDEATATIDLAALRERGIGGDGASAAAEPARAEPAPVPAKAALAAPKPAPQRPAAPPPVAASRPEARPSSPAVAGPLGLDVVMRWSGELHKALFFPRPQTVTIGRNGHFVVPEDVMGGREVETLVAPDAKDGFVLLLANPAIAGQIIAGDQVVSIADVKAGRGPYQGGRVPITATTQAFLEFGSFTFVLSRGAVPPLASPQLWSQENTVLTVCWLLAMALIVGPVVASFQLTDPRDRRTKTYVEELDERTAQIIEVEKIEEEKKEDKADEKKEEAKAEAPKNEVQVMPQEVLKREQDKLQKQIDQAPADQKDDKVKEIVRNEADKRTAKVDELVNALPTTKMFGEIDPNAPVAGPGAAVVIANTGDGPDSPGTGGRGGPEVGSDGDTRRQGGDLDKKIGPSGDGKTPQIGADLAKRDQKVISISGKPASSDGELSPDIIRKVMVDKNGAIRACYQKELQKNPDLAGAIKVAFMIGADGKVVGVKIESSSIDNVAVENCIVDNIKSWRFPQAKGGGSTKVNKTFQFKAS